MPHFRHGANGKLWEMLKFSPFPLPPSLPPSRPSSLPPFLPSSGPYRTTCLPSPPLSFPSSLPPSLPLSLPQAGFKPICVFEKNADVGGTWHVNTYPGREGGREEGREGRKEEREGGKEGGREGERAGKQPLEASKREPRGK